MFDTVTYSRLGEVAARLLRLAVEFLNPESGHDAVARLPRDGSAEPSCAILGQPPKALQ